MPRLRPLLLAVPFIAGVATAVALWGDKAPRLFFATAAEVLALGAVAAGLHGRLFRIDPSRSGAPGGLAMATILISVGTGLAFAFGALGRQDGGGDPHLAVTAGALAMGAAAIAIQAIFGTPGVPDDEE